MAALAGEVIANQPQEQEAIQAPQAIQAPPRPPAPQRPHGNVQADIHSDQRHNHNPPVNQPQHNQQHINQPRGQPPRPPIGPDLENRSSMRDLEMLQSSLVDKIENYKFVHSDRRELGENFTPQRRKELWREIVKLYNNLSLSNGTIAEFVMDPNGINWASFKRDEKYWRMYDYAMVNAMDNAHMRRMGRNNDDGNGGRDSRGRQRYGGVQDDQYRDRSRSRDRTSNLDRVEQKEQREQVCFCWIFDVP